MNPLLLGGAGLVAAVLLFWEWRRPDRRHLALRSAATLLAVFALARLSLPAGASGDARAGAEAVLWTAGGVARAAGALPPLRFALPEAAGVAPPRTPTLPDMGTLRRRFPGLRTLQIFGDGLDPAELPALTGLRVSFQPSDPPAAAAPAIRLLWCPRELPLGAELVVRGSVAGLPPGAVFPLSLEAPDGRRTEGATAPADSRGAAAFVLRAAPLSAAGRFTWQLHAGLASEPLGVSVVAPLLPRVLVLAGAPRFDTAALRRWFEAAGGTLTVRTQVGRANAQFAAAQDRTPPFGRVDAPLLADFDLVLADGRALAGLSAGERAALLAAVDQTGLGLLVCADDAVLPPDAPALPADQPALFPWKLTPVGEAPPGEERSVRPCWPGQAAVSEVPVLAAPFAVDLAGDQSLLVDDREDHALAASFRRGRGEIALTLVRATTRWQRGDDEAAFAAYWSFLFTRLARRSGAAAGRWSLVDGDAGPVFVDHPLTLRWSGPPVPSLAPGTVTAAGESLGTVLPLAQDPREPGDWRGTFWPRRAGWHRVASAAGGLPLDFYVHSAAWPVLQGERRRLATACFAAESSTRSAAPAPPAWPGRPVDPVWWFLSFVLASGYLWTERRFAGVKV